MAMMNWEKDYYNYYYLLIFYLYFVLFMRWYCFLLNSIDLCMFRTAMRYLVIFGRFANIDFFFYATCLEM